MSGDESESERELLEYDAIFLCNVRNCFINFKYTTKLKWYVSLKLRQYTPISKMDSCVADRLLYQPFSGSVNMQQLFVPSIPEYKFFSRRYIVSYMTFLIVMQISLPFSTDIADIKKEKANKLN